MKTTLLDASRVMLAVLERIRSAQADLIADNMPAGWGMNRIRSAVPDSTVNAEVLAYDRTSLAHRTIDAMCGLQLLSCIEDHTALSARYDDETTIGNMRADLHREVSACRIFANQLPALELGGESTTGISAADSVKG